MNCKNCGKELNQGVNFCSTCGVAVVDDVKNNAVLNNSVITKSKKFNFWRVCAYITGGILILLTVIFGFAGSHENGFLEPFIGIIILSILLGILGTFIVKWSKDLSGFVYENKSEKLSKEEVSRYKGLRGWLILVIIGLFLTIISQTLGVFKSIVLFTNGTVGFLSNPASETHILGYAGFLKFEIVANILFIACAVYLVFLFFKKNKMFPKYYVIFLIASIVYVILDYLFFSSLAASSGSSIDQVLSKQGTEISRVLISATIWGLYITKSKRVKATFIED